MIAYSSETDATAEARWVARQLDKQDGTCRIAIAHRARYSIADSQHTDNVDQEPVWKALAGTTAINLAAHSHVYGRLAPIDGINVIVSGQGGHDIRELGPQQHRVEEVDRRRNDRDAIHAAVPARPNLPRSDTDGTTYDSETIACERADETAIERCSSRTRSSTGSRSRARSRSRSGSRSCCSASQASQSAPTPTRARGRSGTGMFNLVNEKTIPAFFSGAVLVAGGLVSLVAARVRLYGMHAGVDRVRGAL